MQMLTHLPRLHLRSCILVLFGFCILLFRVFPYDNTLYLLVRWHIIGTLTAKDNEWLSKPPTFPIEMNDIGIIIKTGFSTRDRLLAQSDSLENAHIQGNTILVGDYSTVLGEHPSYDNLQVPVHNILAIMIESGSLLSRPGALRLQYYSNLRNALSSGNLNLAYAIGEAYGWELDIMKHISGLELGYTLMPSKKWYIILDDDTYILNTSLKVILGHLDPSIPYYIGNAVGDYKARFAHGGSAVVLSQAAMYRIFIQNPRVVAKAHLESLDAHWGDKLIATTAMKSGIYLDEKYNHYFNGEAAQVTHIREDRFCVPIISFHKMTPSQILDTGRTFKNTTKPILWIDLWNIYGASTLTSFLTDPFRPNWDHVSRLDEATITTNNIKTKEECLQLCYIHGSTCLAWTWEAESMACHIAPWMIVGNPAYGKYSGVNVPRAIELSDQCLS